MNKHIELVKRYLAGEDVTTEELKASSLDAMAAWVNADAAARAAARAADAAAYAAAVDASAAAAHWVKRYEELTNE